MRALAGRRLSARDRDQPAGAGQGAVLRRRGAAHERRPGRAPRPRGASIIAAVEACMHHPDGGAGRRPVARAALRLPQAEGRDARTRSSTRLGADRATVWMIGDSTRRPPGSARRRAARRRSSSPRTAASFVRSAGPGRPRARRSTEFGPRRPGGLTPDVLAGSRRTFTVRTGELVGAIASVPDRHRRGPAARGPRRARQC